MSVVTLRRVKRSLVEPLTTSTFVIVIEFPSHELVSGRNPNLNERKLCVLQYSHETCSNHGENEKERDLIMTEHWSFP